jgi:hypothetical protein
MRAMSNAIDLRWFVIRRLLHGVSILAVVAALVVAGLGTAARPTDASLEEGDFQSQVLIGRDDDNISNPPIQPAGVAANQSLNNADVLNGAGGNDVLLGLLGSDVLRGGFGNDILVGGPEGGSSFPNSDIMYGDQDNDVAIWAPGDGSDAFLGGTGFDALVFGVTDRANGVPTLTGQAHGFPFGIPTANVSGQGGFCTLERADPSSGYEWLVRFFVRATGNLAVTVRVADVEQVFCTSQAGGQITYADLTGDEPQFVVVSHEQASRINQLVGAIIR